MKMLHVYFMIFVENVLYKRINRIQMKFEVFDFLYIHIIYLLLPMIKKLLWQV
jgi:hypothetical protein